MVGGAHAVRRGDVRSDWVVECDIERAFHNGILYQRRQLQHKTNDIGARQCIAALFPHKKRRNEKDRQKKESLQRNN